MYNQFYILFYRYFIFVLNITVNQNIIKFKSENITD